MSSSKIVIRLDQDVLKEVDTLVKKRIFPSRSRVIQEDLKEKLERLSHSFLAQECAKLDPDAEKALAEDVLSQRIWQKSSMGGIRSSEHNR